MIDTMLEKGRPDFIQVDCKGHAGVSSYPTLVGQQAASYDKDPLALIRKVTEAHHVALYVHYSGVQDHNYLRLHPGEGRFTSEGKSDQKNTSLWSNAFGLALKIAQAHQGKGSLRKLKAIEIRAPLPLCGKTRCGT